VLYARVWNTAERVSTDVTNGQSEYASGSRVSCLESCHCICRSPFVWSDHGRWICFR